MTQNYYKSPHKVSELKVKELNTHQADVFQNVNTVQQQGSLISISSESSKIRLFIKVLYIWFNLCRRFLVPCSECLLVLVQLYNVLVPRSLKT